MVLGLLSIFSLSCYCDSFGDIVKILKFYSLVLSSVPSVFLSLFIFQVTGCLSVRFLLCHVFLCLAPSPSLCVFLTLPVLGCVSVFLTLTCSSLCVSSFVSVGLHMFLCQAYVS